MMRQRAVKICYHAALFVIVRNGFDVRLLAHPRLRAVRTHDQLCTQCYAVGENNLGAVAMLLQRHALCRTQQAHMRCARKTLPQCRLHASVFCDECQFAQARIVRTEFQSRGRRIAENAHGFNARHALGIHTLPCADPGEKCRRSRTDGVDTAIPSFAGRRGRARLYQRHAQPRMLQRQGQARAHQARANYRNVAEFSHAFPCRHKSTSTSRNSRSFGGFEITRST